MLQIGSYVDGKYKVLNKIGQGGMSVVYLALNEKANKTWAIKEVRKDGVQDFTTVKQGLIAETNILKSLNHKYLPSIIDVIDDGDSFLIVMDYIQGKSLDKILKTSMEKDGLPIALDDVISWGKQLCEVFYYLHTRPNPIIYRDMKPGNVMLKPDGEISLIDFGTARTFKQGNQEDTTCLGTPGYASPEQYGGNGQSTPRSDIYCLGATLHHLITGRNPSATPFSFPKITQCRPSLLDENPREDLNKLLGLEMIIDKCTQYEPEDRYESCLEMLYDLEHIEELSVPYRKKLKRKLVGFTVSAVAAVLCGAVSLGCFFAEQKRADTVTISIRRKRVTAQPRRIMQRKQSISILPTNRVICCIWKLSGMTMANFPVRTARILRQNCRKCPEEKRMKKFWSRITMVMSILHISSELPTISQEGAENRPVTNHLQAPGFPLSHSLYWMIQNLAN